MESGKQSSPSRDDGGPAAAGEGVDAALRGVDVVDNVRLQPALAAQAALFAQLQHRYAFMVSRFGEGVFQGRTAVANAVRADVLGTVEMVQSHIVEAVK